MTGRDLRWTVRVQFLSPVSSTLEIIEPLPAGYYAKRC